MLLLLQEKELNEQNLNKIECLCMSMECLCMSMNVYEFNHCLHHLSHQWCHLLPGLSKIDGGLLGCTSVTL